MPREAKRAAKIVFEREEKVRAQIFVERMVQLARRKKIARRECSRDVSRVLVSPPFTRIESYGMHATFNSVCWTCNLGKINKRAGSRGREFQETKLGNDSHTR